MEKFNDLDNEFIDFISEVVKGYGFDTFSSRIFALLFLEPSSVSMDELRDSTGYSLASISNALKTIEKTGFLKITHTPKTKKLFFTIEKDFSKHVRKMVSMLKASKIEPAKENLPALLQRYRKFARGKGAKTNDRLKVIEDYYSHILKMENIIKYMESRI